MKKLIEIEKLTAKVVADAKVFVDNIYDIPAKKLQNVESRYLYNRGSYLIKYLKNNDTVRIIQCYTLIIDHLVENGTKLSCAKSTNLIKLIDAKKERNSIVKSLKVDDNVFENAKAFVEYYNLKGAANVTKECNLQRAQVEYFRVKVYFLERLINADNQNKTCLTFRKLSRYISDRNINVPFKISLT